MSCYHPMVGIPNGDYWPSGKKKYSFQGNLDPVFATQVYPGSIVVPCGHCLGCRLDYSRAWADRMMLELETEKKAIFVTLTYDNDHIPFAYDDQTGECFGYSLNKEDCQLFMKNLRRDYDGKDGHPYAKIRFFLAGEYGPTTFRPHYHAILFGLSLADFPDRVPHGMNELHQQYYEIPTLAAIWQRGFVLASDVSWETCAYVARYVLKKAIPDGLDAEERGVQKEFVLMSRRPGIGKEYLNRHPELFDFEYVTIGTEKGSKKIRIPKYYLKQLELTDKERYDKIKEVRKDMADDAMFRKLSNTSLSYLDQLEVEEENKKRSMLALKRKEL